MPADILIQTPICRLNGFLELNMESPTKWAIWYHVELFETNFQRVTPEINDALENYRNTIRNLLLAGF